MALASSPSLRSIFQASVFQLSPLPCSLISSFFCGQSIFVIFDELTSPFLINSDVPQGSDLSPPLFLLFICDLSLTNNPSEKMKSQKIRPFAFVPYGSGTCMINAMRVWHYRCKLYINVICSLGLWLHCIIIYIFK